MKYTNHEFRLARLDEEAHIDNIVFDECRFTHCVVEPRAIRNCLGLDKRILISDCLLRNCVQERCLVGPVVFRRCSVDGLQSPDGLRVDGALFDQVTLRGKVGTVRTLPDATGTNAAFDLSLHQANQRLYTEVDWAIDITDAVSDSLELYGIPPELIRYDPKRQAIIRRSNVEAAYSEAVESCGETFFGVCIGNLEYFPTADNVCVTIPATGDVGYHREILAELRRLGFADR